MTLSGRAIIKVFLQPGASVDAANAQITGDFAGHIAQMPPGATPPFITDLQRVHRSDSSAGAFEQHAFRSRSCSDLALNFIRPDLVTVPGVEIALSVRRQTAAGERQPEHTALLQAKGLSPADVVTAIGNQNIILPSGTAKIGQFEYDVDLNSSPLTVAELNDLPIKMVGNVADLRSRCGHGFGRLRAADQYRAAGWRARHR